MSISKDTKERLIVALTSDPAGKEVAALLEKTNRLERQLTALLQKMDADTDLTAVDWESSIEGVK